jgi:DNA-binding transcriptional regulator YdaS (Cro superfamily)
MKSKFSKSKFYQRGRKALLKAVQMCKTQQKLAEKCHVKQQYISDWIKNGLPPNRVLSIEKAVNGAVTRHELRPDIYPEE